MLKIRDARAEEVSPFQRPGYETIGAVLEQDGRVVGRIFLSSAHGALFGHDWECTAEDPRGAAMLYLAARRRARAMGFKKFYLHFTPADQLTRDFWKKRGAMFVFEMWEARV